MNSQVQQQLQNAKQLLMQSQHQAAISQCNQIINALNEQQVNSEIGREAQYLKAVAYRLKGDSVQAIGVLNALLSQFPDYARGYQELGYCYADTDKQKSAHNFYQATRFNPALLSAWQQLERVYKRDDQHQALVLCQQQLTFLRSLPKPILGATDLMHEGHLHKAEQICRQFLANNKHHPEGMMLLAEIGVQLKVYSDAEFLLESCIALYPDNDRAAASYQSLLAKLGKFPRAVEVAKQRLSHNPDNFTVRVGLAHALVGVGDLDDAIRIYKDLLKENEDRPAIWVALGHALKAKGDTNDAVSAYKRATYFSPDFGDAYWSLANTKTHRFEDSMLTTMQKYADLSTTKLEDIIHLCFALGKGFEDKGEADTAFKYYQKGNKLKKQTLKFDIARTETALKAQQTAFTQSSFDRAKGCQAPDPIFIVGLPRAGSTLLEQILASHSQVDGTMELHDILGIASSLSHAKTAYPFNVDKLDDSALLALGEQYLSQTAAYRQGAPYFIDKMPNNFIHIGLIKKILPNAKIIDARRAPLDCCFSGYKQLFGEGQEFSYGLADIGRYHNAYVELMSHWHSVLPGEILTVQHEDVLDDLERQVRRILAYCGLPFEAQCLNFHQTKRVIKTPSSEQVRQPIYKTGMAQWKPFEAHLDELKAVVAHHR
jgi:predicted Zn-dependent protease